ncbi:endo-1,4-beta-xylanase 5-like [Gastrolobium bilobum]|uniref:endo-1,4-beta-xylanase 5-like n=1 Tax=Gastrolobium bilobum TaxID=150636 RepID=UPI002AB10146|nr:endo-1,4-beta-xylanase 5-like [Gastrolobium bilobum]
MRLVLLLCVIIFAGFEAEALSYDYTASIECLEYPQKPQYNGGIIQNPELNNDLKGWTPYGGAIIEYRESLGNKYVVAHSRNQANDSVSQKIFLQKDEHYTLSAWIQVSEGNVQVNAIVKTTKGLKLAGAIVAESNCWSMLKGGLTADTSGAAELYFESNNTSVDIWIDSISLQPFTEKQWRSHQDQSIEKARKRKVLVQVVDDEGNPLPNASISIIHKKSSFPFGSAINHYILNNSAYQNWFTSRFTVTTFENEMKWYSTEYMQGKENYSVADAMLQFAKQHNIAVRGHNVFWDDPSYQQSWVTSLSLDQLKSAVQRRVNSIVSRYKGQLIAWDVVNENLHFSFFESKLGQKFSARMLKKVHNIDRKTTLFLNDYNTIEDSTDGLSSPAKYIQKLREIQSYAGHRRLPIGIGVESHFPNSPPNLPYMRASIDTLAATGLPIWITELDVESQPNQAEYLEQVLREAYSHPHVQGIVLWTAWSPQGCYRMCLVDNNFKNLPTGDVVDKLLSEWGLKKLLGTTDQNGFLEASLFHGHYEMEISHPFKKNYTFTQNLQVILTDEFNKTNQFIQLSL